MSLQLLLVRAWRVFGVGVVIVASAVLLIGRVGCARAAAAAAAAAAASPHSCPNAGLKLPPGFCATVFADQLGHARHLAVADNGVVYVNTWSGRYYGNLRAAFSSRCRTPAAAARPTS